MKRMIFPAALALSLAACGGGTTTTTTTTTTTNEAAAAAADPNLPDGNAMAEAGYQAEVANLPVPARNAVFIRALRDARQNCQQVTESLRQPRPGLWAVRCDDGAGYGVMITPDGTAQVVAAP